ncbi:hypothetical protein JXD38_04625 [candidate division WOR-3 bacterium]|nr:hypothetical protein [candidate division WOR-3 bacterium]
MKHSTKRDSPAGCGKVTASIASDNLNRELATGYKAMVDEDRRTAEDGLGSGIEFLDLAESP